MKPLEKVNILPVADAPSSQLVPQSETASVLHMIERAARDPSVDITKLEKLLDWRKTTLAEEAEREFNSAMATIQGKMRAVAADANNPQTKSKYASYFALDKAIRQIYSSEGIGLSFNTEDSPKEDHVRVVCFVTRGSHTRKYHIDMPADGKGAKGGDVMTKTHAVGSAMTYGQRYLLKMIFNIAIGDDDDGNAAGRDIPRISQLQADTIRDLLEANGKDRGKFLTWAKVEQIEDIRADYFQACVDAIKRKPAQ